MNGLTVVIQAGGESRRMGKPKALVLFCGIPLICRGLKRLSGIADQLIITSNHVESLEFLCSGVTRGDLELYADVYNMRGALSGLYTALYYAKQASVAVVACDMVFPSASLLKAEHEVLLSTEADLVVPKTTHGYEPFHAVYRRETCLPLIKDALDKGEIRATSWYDKAQVVEFTLDDVLAADPRGGSFVNVNTPEELRHIEERILTGEMTEISGWDEHYYTHDPSLCKPGYSCGYLEV
ncbi:MAG: molybdenum cofactor guanylyltransferase [Coriobacteriia bacterium]|nr:molybdenum cofactor guanylyltransferase [Coriobacteriia bacterium]